MRGLALVLFGGGCITNPTPEVVAGTGRIPLISGQVAYAHVEPPGELRRDRPVLLVPGAAWLERDLRIPDRPVVYLDLPGRGEADLADPAVAGLERDLASLEALRVRLGLERVLLLGWGYYGGLAVRYALAHPERVAGLVLVAPLPPRRTPHWGDFVARLQLRTDPAALERLAALRAAGEKRRHPFEYCREFTRIFVESRTADPAAVRERMQSDPCVRPNLDPELGAALGGATVQQLGDWDWRRELASLRTPVLLIHGREDPYPLEGSQEYAASIPGARLEILEDTGHLPWLESPERFLELLDAFLGSLAESRSGDAAGAP